MARRIVTAAAFEQMTPDEQDAAFRSSIVTSLDDVPAEFLDRVRERLERRAPEDNTPKRP